MTLREKIGQRLMVGFPGTAPTREFLDFLREYKIGNIILFERNIRDGEQTRALCAELKEAITDNTGVPPFIAIDQEGGNIVRLKEDAVNVPGAMAVAATGDPENAALAGRITGRELRSLGINMNLAPVLDVNSNPGNPVICERSYGENADLVSQYGICMMQGLLQEGILPCVKHFPGHGDTEVDSHLGLPVVKKSLQELRRTEIFPFQKAVQAGAPAVMTAHICFPALDGGQYPATMSGSIVTGLLRGELDFKGLILSDCLEMAAIRKQFGVTEGCIRAMEAGVDMVLISHTMAYAAKASDALLEKAGREEIFAENVEQSLRRILYYKKNGAGRIREADEQGCRTERACDRAAAQELLERTIAPVHMLPQGLPPLGEKPLFIGCPIFDATGVENTETTIPPFAEAMAAALGGEAEVLSPDAEGEELRRIAGRARGHSCVVLAIYHAGQSRGQLQLARELAEQPVPVIAVSLKSPYELADLPENIASLAAWEYSPRSFEALAKILSGKRKMTGRLPVKVSRRPAE